MINSDLSSIPARGSGCARGHACGRVVGLAELPSGRAGGRSGLRAVVPASGKSSSPGAGLGKQCIRFVINIG